MNGWVIFLITMPFFLAIIITIVFRIYYRTHSKEEESKKIPRDPLENPDEIKRKESFRQQLRNFLQKY
ncbi:MAG: hypothetical protein ACXAAM_02220 [Candidatus Heimdallarchaeaceae archaeon]|jgi:hypothetical protein